MDTNFKKVSDFLHSKNSIAIKDELKGRLACLYNANIQYLKCTNLLKFLNHPF